MKKYLELGSILSNGGRNYVIEKVLGEGGFGITYKAYLETKIGGAEYRSYYAIKEYFLSDSCERNEVTNGIFYSNPVKDRVETCMRDFISEARRLSQLSHPNVVKVHEVFEANQTAYYVMDYIDGGSLTNQVGSQGALPLQMMIEVITPIVDAVAYLHQNRITHLDIKPSNIMLKVNPSTNKITPMLIDFGLSKHYDEKGQATSTMRMGGYSPGFAPLEQYVGITTYSPQSDVYSLAATMLYCLSGQIPPIASELSRGGVLDEYVGRIVPNPNLKGLLTYAMRANAEERPQSAIDFKVLLNATISQMNHSPNIGRGDLEATQILSQNQGARPQCVPPPMPQYNGYESPRGYGYSNAQQPKKSNKGLWIALCLIIFGLSVGAVTYWVLSKDFRTKNETTEVLDDNDQNNESERESTPSLSNPHWSGDLSASQKSVISNLLSEMISVDGGSFAMGTKGVTKSVGSFHISKYEITQSQWNAVMGTTVQYQYNIYKHYKAGRDNPSRRGVGDNYPMYYVSQDDAKEFCRRLSSITGLNFALPTEAQWEYAAKGGGNSGYIYSGGNDLYSVAWYSGNASRISQVGLKQPNELGLYDMSGNVWEWVRETSVIKGGCFLHNSDRCKVSWRWTEPNYSAGWDRGGFRIVME